MNPFRPSRTRPTCECCGRWLVVLDRYRNVCANCGLIEPDELRAVGELCRVFAIDNPWVATAPRLVVDG